MKFFFDNMIPPGVPPYLLSLTPQHKIIHISQKFPRNTDDDVWIEKLAEDGHWNIITIDLNIASTPHLAQALIDAGHTAFFLKRNWSQLRIEDLSWKFPKAWWHIEGTATTRPSRGNWFTVSTGNLKPQLYDRRPKPPKAP